MKSLLLYCCVVLSGCSLFDSIEEQEPPPLLDMGSDAGDIDSGNDAASVDAAFDVGTDLSEMMDAEIDLGPADVGNDADVDSGRMLPLPEAVVAYDFEMVVGMIVEDRTAGIPYDLESSAEGVDFRADGTVVFDSSAILQTTTAPAELAQSVTESREFSVAIWLESAAIDQGNPPSSGTEVRIVSNSVDSATRNFTFAQWGTNAALRVRTEGSNSNGIPQTVVEDAFVDTGLHLFIFQVRAGFMELYRDGVLLHSETTNGDIVDWDETFQLLIGNEASLNRGWAGRVHSLAVYARGLDGEEVFQAMDAGPDGLVPASL